MVSMIHPERVMFAVALATLTLSACGGDSLTAPPSPTAPRPLVAPTTPSPSSSTLQAPSPADPGSEPRGTRGTVAASVAPETAGEETEPGEENAGSEPLPNETRPGSGTEPRDVEVHYRITRFSATPVSPTSVRVSWGIESYITHGTDQRSLDVHLAASAI